MTRNIKFLIKSVEMIWNPVGIHKFRQISGKKSQCYIVGYDFGLIFYVFFRTAPWSGWSAGAEVWPLEVPDMKGSGISKNLSLRGLNKLRKEDQVFSVLDKNFIFYKMFFIFVSCYQSPPIFCWGLELGPADVFDKSTFGILGRKTVRRFLGSNCQNSKV